MPVHRTVGLSLAAVVLLCSAGLHSAHAKPFMIVGLDEKVWWDDDGKTILSAQIGFHRVTEGDTVLYVTLIAESHSKLLAHLKGLSFYNADAISDKMLFVSGYHELMRDGLNAFLALIASTIKANRPRFMVIDGFRSAREFDSGA